MFYSDEVRAFPSHTVNWDTEWRLSAKRLAKMRKSKDARSWDALANSSEEWWKDLRIQRVGLLLGSVTSGSTTHSGVVLPTTKSQGHPMRWMLFAIAPQFWRSISEENVQEYLLLLEIRRSVVLRGIGESMTCGDTTLTPHLV